MIQSFRVDVPPNADGHVFLVFDTVIDGKHVFTACGFGRVVNGEAAISEIAQKTLNAAADHATTQSSCTIQLAEIASVAAVPVRIRKALERANNKDLVFFICRNSEVYDAAYFALNVKADPSSGVQ